MNEHTTLSLRIHENTKELGRMYARGEITAEEYQHLLVQFRELQHEVIVENPVLKLTDSYFN